MIPAKRLLLIFGLAGILIGCNNIPSKSIFEELNTRELSKAIKGDTSFSEFYQLIQREVSKIDDIKRARFSEVTYRRLFAYFKFVQDTVYWKPLITEWEKQWEKQFGIFDSKADSTLRYWKKYLDENSLSKYVSIELVHVDKEYYDYIGELKKVSLGFKLTPLQGTIEQIRFSYGYNAKIHGDDKYFERHNCILTSPFSTQTIRYWEVNYSDRDIFASKNAVTFLRDYDLYIEITNIRKDGVNLNIDDLGIPREVSECLRNEKEYPILFDLSKEELIVALINKSYIGRRDYQIKKNGRNTRKERQALL